MTDYMALRRKAAERSRKRRQKAGEPPPGQGWFCSRCRRSVPRGKQCPGCGTAA